MTVFTSPKNGEQPYPAPVPPIDTLLTFAIVYDHPRDAKDHWVVRTWYVISGRHDPVPDPVGLLFDSLLGARKWIAKQHPQLTRQPRDPNDDPSIHEVYF